VGRTITSAIRELAHTFALAFDPYRPELHYMRGPGPKWHAKWANHATQDPSAVLVHDMSEAAAVRA
jgi:hypothetical protein